MNVQKVDPDFYERFLAITGREPRRRYQVEIRQSYFRCRSRLANLVFLIRRPRGRKLIGIRLYTRTITFHNVKINTER